MTGRLNILVLLLLISTNIISQEWGDSTVLKNPIFYTVEKPPKYPGGTKGLYKFISENISEPLIVSGTLIDRIVVIEFVIDKQGYIVFGRVEKSIDKYHDQEVINLIKKMPKWIPGMQNGKPVLCYQKLPIVFIR